MPTMLDVPIEVKVKGTMTVNLTVDVHYSFPFPPYAEAPIEIESIELPGGGRERKEPIDVTEFFERNKELMERVCQYVEANEDYAPEE